MKKGMLILLQIVFIFMLSSPLQAFELEGWWMTNENVIQEMKIIHFSPKTFQGWNKKWENVSYRNENGVIIMDANNLAGVFKKIDDSHIRCLSPRGLNYKKISEQEALNIINQNGSE
ncbi:hypothetical protein QUW15_13765 [Desulfovibrio piger]|nr:hypothetical protein [Desulfovibrio piger]